ncbi:MAG: stage V sporulation protein AD, partial [Oscillospiraceae bacterium]|nr:stage V sporulation protein AD [Oscillospiraceae bacterium]
NFPSILSYASVVGKKEAEGPLGRSFDLSTENGHFGQSSWEKAESHMQRTALSLALSKGNLKEEDLQAVFLGDLLNQCIGSSYSMRSKEIPTLGLYGACSTMSESLLLGAMCVSGGFCNTVAAMTSSHFASSERQYRFPLGYGGQRTPTAQWTVTGSGAVILGAEGTGPYICAATIGCIVDPGIRDANNMGAAMAPAAFETLCAHFRDLGCRPEDYDLIVTGDLGALGSHALRDLMDLEGYPMGNRYKDCGVMIYDIEGQDVHCGGSGCGCSAVVLCGYLLNKMHRREIRRLLFCGTGALLSPVSIQQGESIPGVCHAVSICMDKEDLPWNM